MNELISLVVSTYNRPDALGACLRSLLAQNDRNFEIVVADDGSGPATRDVIKAWAAEAGVPVGHVWQEDRGFRLAEIRNRAIAASAGSYLIFLDGAAGFMLAVANAEGAYYRYQKAWLARQRRE